MYSAWAEKPTFFLARREEPEFEDFGESDEKLFGGVWIFNLDPVGLQTVRCVV